jgi:hypothetical protein
MTQPSASPRPRSRAWLYGPFIVLGVLAAGWSGFWFYAKAKSEEVLDKIIVREAELGRRWTCQDRAISGFPFRFEARCATVALKAERTTGALSINSGALVLVAQIYNPQHIILKATGPATITQPDGAKATLRWSAYDSSFYLSGLSFDRLATVIVNPQFETPTGQSPLKAASLELHGRRNPGRFASDGVIDVSLSAKTAILPALDELAGNETPADIELTASLTRSLVFMTGLKPENIDLWRTNGGRAEITRLAITKGISRFETKGELGLDDQRRLAGRLESSAAGIDRIAGIPLGGLGNLGGLLTGRAPAPPTGAAAALRSLPPVEFRDGRVQAGPFRVPRLQLSPLY